MLRLVARQPTTSLAKAAGVPRTEADRQTVRLAAHLVTQIQYETQQQWTRARQAGSTDRETAINAGVGVALVRLVLDGIPPPLPGGRINPYLLRQLLEQGRPRRTTSGVSRK